MTRTISKQKNGEVNNFATSYTHYSKIRVSLLPIFGRCYSRRSSRKRISPDKMLAGSEIVNMVASKLGISADSVSNFMWSDQEENLILERFESITPESLIAWYNLSLIQTLLFNCIKLEFSLTGGTNWKYALRSCKKARTDV